MSSDIPPAPPEAEVIRLARLAADMTAERAAEASRAQDGRGVSATYWRDFERGRGGRRGQAVPVRASERALAIMASVVGVTPAQLTEAGREDAARVLEEIERRDRPSRPRRTRVNAALTLTDDLIPYVHQIADEFANGEEPPDTERIIWDSELSDKEKWHLAARLRQAADQQRHEAERGAGLTAPHLAIAGNSPSGAG